MSIPIRSLPLGGAAGEWVSLFAIEYDEVPRLPLITMLSPAEQDRARRFAGHEDRARFAARHAMVRLVLAERLGRSPKSLEFDTIGAGKPVLRSAGPGIGEVHFSVSTTRRHAVLAVSGQPVGIDIEDEQRGVWNSDMARLVLSRSELDWVCTQQDRDRAFLQCWTRKEALAKLDGAGLHDGIEQVTVTPECTRSDITVVELSLVAGAVVALAVAAAHASAGRV